MNYRDLARRLGDAPFKPFRIRMVNNTTFDVFDPGMVIFGETSAVVATQHVRDERGRPVPTDWRTISISHILEFADINEKETSRRRRGA